MAGSGINSHRTNEICMPVDWLNCKNYKYRVDKQKVSPSCRMFGESGRSVAHVTAECKMLAQKYYKSWRHDKVA